MTDILAGGVPCADGLVRQIAEAERQTRAFLVTATRYLATGSDLVALNGLEGVDADCLSADEFDRKLLRVWKNQ